MIINEMINFIDDLWKTYANNVNGYEISDEIVYDNECINTMTMYECCGLLPSFIVKRKDDKVFIKITFCSSGECIGQIFTNTVYIKKYNKKFSKDEIIKLRDLLCRLTSNDLQYGKTLSELGIKYRRFSKSSDLCNEIINIMKNEYDIELELLYRTDSTYECRFIYKNSSMNISIPNNLHDDDIDAYCIYLRHRYNTFVDKEEHKNDRSK